MKLIVGLGNTGDKFMQTRHNAGFMTIDLFLAYVQRLGIVDTSQSWEKAKGVSALQVVINDVGGETIMVKPQTFMNLSGDIVRFYLKKYVDLRTENILIVHDDMGFPLGEYKFSLNKEANSHNGVQSIIDSLGTPNFWRLRVGIGGVVKRERNQDAAEYVLAPFSYWENKRLKQLLTDTLPEQILLWEQGKIN